MNSKKDYVRASKIVRDFYAMAPIVGKDVDGEDIINAAGAGAVEEAFVCFFHADNPKFDEKKFRAACLPKQ